MFGKEGAVSAHGKWSSVSEIRHWKFLGCITEGLQLTLREEVVNEFMDMALRSMAI